MNHILPLVKEEDLTRERGELFGNQAYDMYSLREAYEFFNNDMEFLATEFLRGDDKTRILKMVKDNKSVLYHTLVWEKPYGFFQTVTPANFADREVALKGTEGELAGVAKLMAIAEKEIEAEKFRRIRFTEAGKCCPRAAKFSIAKTHLRRAMGRFDLGRRIGRMRNDSLREIDYVKDYYDKVSTDGQERGEASTSTLPMPDTPRPWATLTAKRPGIPPTGSLGSGKVCNLKNHPPFLPTHSGPAIADTAAAAASLSSVADSADMCQLCKEPMAENPQRYENHPRPIITDACCYEAFHAHCLYKWIKENQCKSCGVWLCPYCDSALDRMITIQVIYAKASEYGTLEETPVLENWV